MQDRKVVCRADDARERESRFRVGFCGIKAFAVGLELQFANSLGAELVAELREELLATGWLSMIATGLGQIHRMPIKLYGQGRRGRKRQVLLLGRESPQYRTGSSDSWRYSDDRRAQGLGRAALKALAKRLAAALALGSDTASAFSSVISSDATWSQNKVFGGCGE